MGKFLKIMSKVQNLFNAWSLRELSLYDKITIVKTLGLWKLVFVSACIHTLLSVLYRYDHDRKRFAYGAKRKRNIRFARI